MTRRFMSRAICAVFALTILVSSAANARTASSHSAHAATALPLIRHVFVITLENKNYDTTFGASSEAPYLAQTLVKQGALLTQYYGTGHASLDNYVAMVSGQSTTPETSADCNIFADFKQTGTAEDGQAVGSGCVYPASVKTLADQLNDKGLTWKGYMEDMGNDPSRESATCGHPIVNTQDFTERAEAPSATVPQGDQYATRHDPFMYFHSIIDSPSCQKNVVNLTKLKADLQSISTTANFNFITPNLCNDAHDAHCVNGQPGGLKSANDFLQQWVPLILASPAYKKDGLLIINFDEGSYGNIQQTKDGVTITVEGATCCNQKQGPNLKAQFPVEITRTVHGQQRTQRVLSFGGERTGAVMLSKYIKPGTITNVPYNHYSLLKSLEDIFQTNGYLGYAGQAGLVSFGPDIFTNHK